MLEEAIDDLWGGRAETIHRSTISSQDSESHALPQLEPLVAHQSSLRLYRVRYGVLRSVPLMRTRDRSSVVRARMTEGQNLAQTALIPESLVDYCPGSTGWQSIGHPTAVGRAHPSRWRSNRPLRRRVPHSFAAEPRSARPALRSAVFSQERRCLSNGRPSPMEVDKQAASQLREEDSDGVGVKSTNTRPTHVHSISAWQRSQ